MNRFAGKVWVAATLSALLLSGCGYFDDEERLPGDRIPVRQTADDRAVPPNVAAELGPVTAPRAVANWTQTNGNAQHASGHLAAPGTLSIAWRADIGVGGENLTATPVVADGRVYTLDAAAQVSAFSTDGNVLWRTRLAPEFEDAEDGFGGGLAFENGQLFVTTGFGQVIALAAASGEEIWRQSMAAPIRAAPSVLNGVVIAIARDNTAFAFAAEDGAIRWRVSGATSNAGVLGGSSAAISPGGVAILPFGSGELVAVRATTGQRIWGDVLSGGRRGLARSVISDISADPVILGVAVIAGNTSGRLVAIDGRNGRRGWTREFGANGPVWADGATLFVVTDAAELKRISGQDGGTLWTTPLREYLDEDDREDAVRYGGPVLAGGRVLVTSSEGELLSFNPVTGDAFEPLDVSGAAGLTPVVAGGAVYVITASGGITALR